MNRERRKIHVATKKRSAPPPDVLTRARLSLLAEVMRGRVRWVVPHGPALLTPRQKRGMVELVDVTRTFLDLVKGKVAKIDPWDDEHRPASVECRTTAKGDNALMSAQSRAAMRRSTRAIRSARERRVATRSRTRKSGIDSLVALGRSIWKGSR
jgi:hypothetical protein